MGDVITREDLIKKGEAQLAYILRNVKKCGDDHKDQNIWAETGRSMLDMLSYILDEEYENYDYWFDKFMYYDCE